MEIPVGCVQRTNVPAWLCISVTDWCVALRCTHPANYDPTRNSVTVRHFAFGLRQVLTEDRALVDGANVQAVLQEVKRFTGTTCPQCQNGVITTFAV